MSPRKQKNDRSRGYKLYMRGITDKIPKQTLWRKRMRQQDLQRQLENVAAFVTADNSVETVPSSVAITSSSCEISSDGCCEATFVAANPPSQNVPDCSSSSTGSLNSESTDTNFLDFEGTCENLDLGGAQVPVDEPSTTAFDMDFATETSQLDVSPDREQDHNNGGNTRQPRQRFYKIETRGAEPIYPGSKCNKGTLLSLLLAFTVRHQLSKTALQDLLDLFNEVIPGSVPRSKYYLELYFFRGTKGPVTRHFYCNGCQKYLGEFVDHGQRCSFCDMLFDTEEVFKNGNYFLVTSIEDQLRDFLENSDLWADMKNAQKDRETKDPSKRSDLYSGPQYAANEELRLFISNDRNFSLSFNVDGVPISKSSNYSVWPILCTVNEIKFNLRSKYSVLSTVWFGKKPKNGNTLLTPFVKEINKLFHTGLAWKCRRTGESYVSRVLVSVGVCDSPARSMIMNFKQYNGYFGCEKCEHRGERVARGEGSTMVYPLTSPAPKRRTLDSILKQGHEVECSETAGDVAGVQGLSHLTLLPLFDMSRAMVTDYMHCIILGVCRQLISLWFDVKGEVYSIRNLNVIDQVMKTVKPPSEIRRLPRPFQPDRCFFKASELRNFILFYSPVALRTELPKAHYRHWMVLVTFTRMLLQREILAEDVVKLKLLAWKFCAEVEELYGKEHCSYNVHQLFHIAEATEDWGAPWSFSGFVFEDLLGFLKNLFSGTRFVPEQIATNYLAKNDIMDFAQRYLPTATEGAQDVFESLLGERKWLIENLGIECIGTAANGLLDNSELLAIESCIGSELQCKHADSFDRLGVNGKIYCTASYAGKNARDNSLVKLGSRVFRIKKILLVSLSCRCSVGLSSQCLLRSDEGRKILILGNFFRLSEIPPMIEEQTRVNLVECLREVSGEERSLRCIFPTHISGKCVIVANHKQTFCLDVSDVRFEKD